MPTEGTDQMPVLLREDQGGIVTLTLNRPARFNLLTREMLRALQEALDALARDQDARVVVLAAAGKGFCAGHDLAEIQALGEAPAIEALFAECGRVMESLQSLPQPVIARVHGVAAAAGCQLVAQCDLAVASEAARFSTPGATWGFFCSTPGVAVGRNLARKHALEMLLTGEAIDARRALEWGLVNRVVAPEALDQEVTALARTLAAKPKVSLRAGKRAFYEQMEMASAPAYARASAVIARSFAHMEGREGMAAFLGKRRPPGG